MWGHWDFTDGSHQHIMGFHHLREPDFFYTHKSDPKAEFWTPVPICDTTSKPTINSPLVFISCATRRGYFRLGEKVDLGSSVIIRTESGKWAGCLEPHHKKQIVFSDSSLEGAPKSGDTCELAAISWGFAYYDNYEYGMDEWSCKERPKLGEKYEFYNVMWISWMGAIAYRNAIERVVKDVWNAEALETIDLVLG
jgi:hypothetical protein